MRSRSASPPRARRRGICKLEVALIAGIVALTAALAVPGWQREQREKADKAARSKGEKAAKP